MISSMTRREARSYIRQALIDDRAVNRVDESAGFYLTQKCPLRCDHCYIDSHPNRTERMEQRELLAWIDELAAIPSVKYLVFSGGEAFLEREMLAEALARAASYDFFTTVITSAYWARDPAIARREVERLAGLSHLIVSVDQPHEAFVPLPHVRNAVLAAKEFGVLSTVGIGMYASEHADAAYRQELIGLIRVYCGQPDRVVSQQFELVGRGARQLSPARLELSGQFPGGTCPIMSPVVDTDGSVYTCCGIGPPVRRDDPHLVGNAREEALGAILQRQQADWLLQLLRTHGPVEVARQAVEAGLESQLGGRYESGGVCALCHDVLSKPAIVAASRQALQDRKLRREIAVRRFAIYGEEQMLKLLEVDATEQTPLAARSESPSKEVLQAGVPP